MGQVNRPRLAHARVHGAVELGVHQREQEALDDGEIANGVAAGSPAVVDCIKDAAGAAPLSGQVTLQMLVGADGHVSKVRVRAAVYLHEHGLTACAKRAARGFDFAATGAPTVVTAPFFLN